MANRLTNTALVSGALVASTPAWGSPRESSNPSHGAPTSSPTISDTQSEVSAIETQIVGQQQQLATLSEQYDQATVHLARLQSRLTEIRTQVVTDRARFRTAPHQLQEDAVNAYVYDTPATSLSSMFASSSDTNALHSEYKDTAIGDLDAAVARVKSREHQLLSTETCIPKQSRRCPKLRPCTNRN